MLRSVRWKRASGSLLAALALGLIAPPSPAQVPETPPAGCTGPASQTWLSVTIEDVRSASGLIALTLYADDSSRFLVKRGSLYVTRVPAAAGATQACIFLPQPGVYALAIYHDEDGNQTFKRTALGLPAEGFGFSNNPATLAGLPSFRAVRMNVPRAGLSTRIRIKYP